MSRWNCQGGFIEGEADGGQDPDSSSSGGLEDGPDVGIESGAPLGSEAIGDLAEDDAGPKCLLGAVIGRRDGAVGDEDEEVLAEALDDGHALEQVVEPGLEQWHESRCATGHRHPHDQRQFFGKRDLAFRDQSGAGAGVAGLACARRRRAVSEN